MLGTKDWERLYRDAARLIETIPPLDGTDLAPKDHEWLGRAYALIAESGTGESVVFTMKVNDLQSPLARTSEPAAKQIRAILYRTYAVAERNAPASVAGTFIASGETFDAFAALAKIFQTATNAVLLIDAYMDETALTDFAVMVPEGVPLRLLADQADHKPSLAPAARRWHQQYAAKRPIELRLAPPKALHDRAIFLDGKVWLVSQSLNGIAKRSPATIQVAAPEIAAAKLAAYEAVWNGAQSVKLT